MQVFNVPYILIFQGINLAVWTHFGKEKMPKKLLISDLVKKYGALLLYTGNGIKVHCSRPALPVLACRLTIPGAYPLVKSELNPGFLCRSDKLGKGQKLLLSKLIPARCHKSSHVKTAYKRPNTSIMIFPRPIIFIVSRHPVRVGRPDKWEQIRRHINCQISAFFQVRCFPFCPRNNLFSPR
jgi:hypothetical protein